MGFEVIQVVLKQPLMLSCTVGSFLWFHTYIQKCMCASMLLRSAVNQNAYGYFQSAFASTTTIQKPLKAEQC